MTHTQLEYLIAVVNCGNFTAAAESCFVTQPTLSVQIKMLEDELGVILLDRSRKPVVPTLLGERVVEQARTALEQVERIREIVKEYKGEISGTLRLGVIPTIAPYLIHKFLPSFMSCYDGVRVEIREMKTAEIIDALNRDALDVAIVAGGTCADKFIETELFPDRFYAYVSTHSPLYQKSNIRLEDIKMDELVLLSVGNCMRDQVLELCQKKRESFSKCIFESGSVDTLMRIVDVTNSITIIPEMAIEFIKEENRQQVKTLFRGASSRMISMVRRRNYVKQSLFFALRKAIVDAVGK
ncbi:MAG: LysR family transcriptional regulator [Alistipes sp.]|nr:LysR family transcriptional regulator [Candidatus Alistipes equi]